MALSYRVKIMPHVSVEVDASYHTTPSELKPPRLVPSAPASWQRVSTRTPPLVFCRNSQNGSPDPGTRQNFVGFSSSD